MINVVREFCNKWRLKSNIKKIAVMVFSQEVVKSMCTCTWKWRDKEIPRVVSYCYLGIEFANGSWDSHVQNRSISTVARRLLLVSVLRPNLEYGSEVWACNKRQTSSLESIQLGAAILLDNEWEVKPCTCRGRQRKTWRKVICCCSR